MNKVVKQDKVQFVTFVLGNQYFGIDILTINEVYPSVNITEVPLCEEYIKGHVNVRGQVVLILDLMVIFKKTQSPILPESHIIIFKTSQQILRAAFENDFMDVNIFGDKPVGVIVDNIGDVLSISSAMIEKPTEHLNDKYFQFTTGVVKTQENIYVLIDPVKILKYSLDKQY